MGEVDNVVGAVMEGYGIYLRQFAETPWADAKDSIDYLEGFERHLNLVNALNEFINIIHCDVISCDEAFKIFLRWLWWICDGWG